MVSMGFSRHQIGNFKVSLDNSTDKVTIHDEANGQSLCTSLHEFLCLVSASERLGSKVMQARLRSPGLIVHENLERNNFSMTSKELLDLLVETEAAPSGESASKWWLAFLEENKERPVLVSRLIAELRARSMTINDFFLTYVYSNTDNIQANLDFADYRRLRVSRPDSSATPELLKTLKALLLEFEKSLDIDPKSTPSTNLNWWNKFCSCAANWTSDDALALVELMRSVRSLTHLIRIAALASTNRPVALLHFRCCLDAITPQVWPAILAFGPDLECAAFAPHFSVINILLEHELAAAAGSIKQFTLADLETALKNLPACLTEEKVLRLVSALSYGPEEISDKELQLLSQIFSYTVSVETLREQVKLALRRPA